MFDLLNIYVTQCMLQRNYSVAEENWQYLQIFSKLEWYTEIYKAQIHEKISHKFDLHKYSSVVKKHFFFFFFSFCFSIYITKTISPSYWTIFLSVALQPSITKLFIIASHIGKYHGLPIPRITKKSLILHKVWQKQAVLTILFSLGKT